jgi:colanic acid biosynthesis glycosyl transferase WcaI
MEKLRIGVLCEFFYPDGMGGTGAIISHLARHLQDDLLDVEVEVEAITSRNVYRGQKGRISSFENWHGIKIYRVGTPKSNGLPKSLRVLAGLLFTVAALIKLLSRPRYDVMLVSTQPPMAPWATRALQIVRGTPYVYLIHDLFADLSLSLGLATPQDPCIQVSQKLQRQWLHGAAVVVALGRCMKMHLQKTFELPDEQVQVITNWGMDKPVVSKENSEFRRQHGLKGFTVLYGGNFGQFHNFEGILDAALLLRDKRPDITFVFVGDGAKAQAIADRIQKDSLSNVRLCGLVPQEKMNDVLGSADVSLVTLEPGAEGLVVPSKLYGIMSAGCAALAIMQSYAESALTIEEWDCGMRVDNGSAQNLAQVIQDLADDPERVAQMGRNARRAFEEKFTLEKVGREFYHVLKAAAGRKSTTVDKHVFVARQNSPDLSDLGLNQEPL